MTEYVYVLGNGKEFCRSKAPVDFNVDLFPQFAEIEPQKIDTKTAGKEAVDKERKEG